MLKSDFFEGITQAPAKVGNYDIHVPIFYHDITSMGVFLLAPPWNLVYFKWNYPDSTVFEYPGNIQICNGRMMLLDDNAIWYFRYKTNTDSAYTIDFGDMKYKFDGKIYQETYLSAQDDKFIGQTFHYNVTISNDTLTLTGPEDGEVDKLGANVLEIFVRE